jgi:hypothetical protein
VRVKFIGPLTLDAVQSMLMPAIERALTPES